MCVCVCVCECVCAGKLGKGNMAVITENGIEWVKLAETIEWGPVWCCSAQTLTTQTDPYSSCFSTLRCNVTTYNRSERSRVRHSVYDSDSLPLKGNFFGFISRLHFLSHDVFAYDCTSWMVWGASKKYIVLFIKNRTPLMMHSVMTVGTVNIRGFLYLCMYVCIYAAKQTVCLSVYVVVIN